MWTKKLKIDGMTCPNCAEDIEKNLNAYEGVEIEFKSDKNDLGAPSFSEYVMKSLNLKVQSLYSCKKSIEFFKKKHNIVR